MVTLFCRSLGSLSVLFGQVVRGMSAGARVFEYMELQSRVALRGGHTLPKEAVRGGVSFEGVTFAYPTRQDQAVLRELTLELPAGQVTALCGLSGAGETAPVIIKPPPSLQRHHNYLRDLSIMDKNVKWLFPACHCSLTDFPLMSLYIIRKTSP